MRSVVGRIFFLAEAADDFFFIIFCHFGQNFDGKKDNKRRWTSFPERSCRISRGQKRVANVSVGGSSDGCFGSTPGSGQTQWAQQPVQQYARTVIRLRSPRAPSRREGFCRSFDHVGRANSATRTHPRTTRTMTTTTTTTRSKSRRVRSSLVRKRPRSRGRVKSLKPSLTRLSLERTGKSTCVIFTTACTTSIPSRVNRRGTSLHASAPRSWLLPRRVRRHDLYPPRLQARRRHHLARSRRRRWLWSFINPRRTALRMPTTKLQNTFLPSSLGHTKSPS